MKSQLNKEKIISIRKGEIIAVRGDLTGANSLTFRLENTNFVGSSQLPADGMSLDFATIRFNRSLYKQTIYEYVAQNLEGKFTGKTESQQWIKAFGLSKYASKTLASLPRQARYRLLFLSTITCPVSVLKMSNTRNFENFAEFMLDVKRFFRDQKLGLFCPGFVILEERETPETAILVDGIIMLKCSPQRVYQSLV